MLNLGQPPPVFVAETQFDRLFNLASAASTPGAHLLRGELERAVIVDETEARSFARLGDAVRYRDLRSGAERRAVLVTPDRSDIDQGRLSVLTLAGASLIGLEPGARIGWSDPMGRLHELEVLETARS